MSEGVGSGYGCFEVCALGNRIRVKRFVGGVEVGEEVGVIEDVLMIDFVLRL